MFMQILLICDLSGGSDRHESRAVAILFRIVVNKRTYSLRTTPYALLSKGVEIPVVIKWDAQSSWSEVTIDDSMIQNLKSIDVM